jgi:hypothetical protein
MEYMESAFMGLWKVDFMIDWLKIGMVESHWVKICYMKEPFHGLV